MKYFKTLYKSILLLLFMFLFSSSSVKAGEKQDQSNECTFYLSSKNISKHFINNDVGVVKIPSTVHKRDLAQSIAGNQAFPSIEEIAENQNKNPFVRFLGIHFGETPEDRARRKQAERQQSERNNPGSSSRVTKEKSGSITKHLEMTQKTRALPGGGTAPLTGRSDPYHSENRYDFNNMNIHLDPMRNPRERPSRDHVWNKRLNLWVKKALPLIKDPFRGHELPLPNPGYKWEWSKSKKQWTQVKLPSSSGSGSSSGSPQFFGVSPFQTGSTSLPQNTYSPNTTYCYIKGHYVLKKHHTWCPCYNPNHQ